MSINQFDDAPGSGFYGRVTVDLPLVSEPATAEPATLDPDEAVRGRFNALIVDNILVGVSAAIIYAALGFEFQSPRWIVAVLLCEFAYFWYFERRSGQTPGKRWMRVRVVSRDGIPATGRQVAIRNVLRIVDAFPAFYASGLISLMRTGRIRRQRIGDIAAGTMVVLSPNGRPLRTPRYVLPVTTVLAVVLSILVCIGIARSSEDGFGGDNATLSSAVPGFGDGPGASPAFGSWTARAEVVTSSNGSGLGQRYAGYWKIVRSCNGTTCATTMVRNVIGRGSISAPLLASADGWRATFAKPPVKCESSTGRTIDVTVYERFVIRFGDGGRVAEARERDSDDGVCGGFVSDVNWTAAHD
ncbi:MAG TPA: RDD family protein [Solirubrobacteraceae bacterium]|nr:RDD family protein [Solirubrobacteraceae bacterium]